MSGPQFRDLHVLLEEYYTALSEHVDALAERMTVLGLIPTCAPKNFSEQAITPHEPEGLFRVRDMLIRDRNAEGKLSVQLRKVAGMCMKLGDFGSERLIKDVLAKAEDRAHNLDHFLEKDTLTQALQND